MKHPETNVFDTATYIKEQYAQMPAEYGVLTATKLQKLVYYAQAWSLVWNEEPLFQDEIEAWVYGPVVRKLFNVSKGHYRSQDINRELMTGNHLDGNQKETIDIIVRDYGNLTPEILVGMTHRERPWQKARESQNLGPGENGNAIISAEDMKKYYSSINMS